MENEKPSLLVIEDDRKFQDTLKIEFEERGYEVTTAASLEEVRNLSPSRPFRFATVDLRLETEFGLPIVEYLISLYPECRIVVLTGYGSIATAVEAMRRGASQYITKPIQVDKLERLLWTDSPPTEEPETSLTVPSLARHEREYIEWVLVQTNGNITEAARRLGIHRQSLQRKIRKFIPK
ncbi:MAG: response regulator [Oligoflexia bacterium]|nr:response regulator [Oligoflexia bacterium]